MPGKRQAVSLNIKNPEVYEAAARLAKLQDTTITAAVLNTVRAELGRQNSRRRAGNEVLRMREFARRIPVLPLSRCWRKKKLPPACAVRLPRP